LGCVGVMSENLACIPWPTSLHALVSQLGPPPTTCECGCGDTNRRCMGADLGTSGTGGPRHGPCRGGSSHG
jgi:hypothetical protein